MGKPQTAVRVLGAATILGAIGVLLFQDASWGINIFFWMLALGTGAVGLSRGLNVPIPHVVRYITPFVLIFAACFAIREAPELKWANGFAIFLLVGALLVRTRSGALTHATLADLTYKAVGAWFKLTYDFATLVVKDVKWTRTQQSQERLRALVRGVTIAAPLLILFGALFAGADDAFRGILSDVFSFDWLNGQLLLQCILIFLFCAVVAAGVYRVILAERPSEVASSLPMKITNPTTLGFTEISVVLGSLDALFGFFVIVQAQYFFGGAHHLKMVEGLTYAQYARHGFFELAIVSAGCLATIFGFHSMLRDPIRNQRGFTILAGILTAFVSVVMLSAFQRMNLYINFAGLTELRVYTAAAMVWLAAVIVCLAATVLRGDRRQFATGAMAAGLIIIFSLNAINPDATIARFNLDNPNRQLDLAYLESLSVDAAPAIVGHSPRLPLKEAAELRAGVRKHWSQDVDTDWRGLNYARWTYLNRFRNEL